MIDPQSGKECGALDNSGISDFLDLLSNPLKNNNRPRRKSLVIVMPQLGDFDSGEYAELLGSIVNDLENANIDLRIVGIGTPESARRFSSFTGIPLNVIRVDPLGAVHRTLGLHGGPNWDIPLLIPDGILLWFADYVNASVDTIDEARDVARAWLNYMAMCAGVAAPKTLPEILRGYLGDSSAPERLRRDEIVTVGDDAIVIRGTTDVKLGPIKYQSLWKDAVGYQRPAELATVRLRVMVEVLSNLNLYVPDQRHIHLRGATFLFDTADGSVLYEHRDTGVLAYSETMSRPLSFLRPYLGDDVALNPLGLGDVNFDKAKEEEGAR